MKKSLLMFAVAAVALVFSSCSKDDDADNNYVTCDGKAYHINSLDIEYAIGQDYTAFFIYFGGDGIKLAQDGSWSGRGMGVGIEAICLSKSTSPSGELISGVYPWILSTPELTAAELDHKFTNLRMWTDFDEDTNTDYGEDYDVTTAGSITVKHSGDTWEISIDATVDGHAIKLYYNGKAVVVESNM